MYFSCSFLAWLWSLVLCVHSADSHVTTLGMSMSFKPSSIFVPLMTTCSDIGRACREESACLHWLTAAWLWLKHMDQCMLSNTPCRHTLMHTYIHYTIQPKPNNKSQAQDWSPPTVLLQEEWGGVRWQRVGWHPPIPQKATDKLPLGICQALMPQVPSRFAQEPSV